MTKVIEITVSGGVVQDVQCPPGVRVVVRDYDVDEADAQQDRRICRDEQNHPYLRAIFEDATTEDEQKAAEKSRIQSKP